MLNAQARRTRVEGICTNKTVNIKCEAGIKVPQGYKNSKEIETNMMDCVHISSSK